MNSRNSTNTVRCVPGHSLQGVLPTSYSSVLVGSMVGMIVSDRMYGMVCTYAMYVHRHSNFGIIICLISLLLAVIGRNIFLLIYDF